MPKPGYLNSVTASCGKMVAEAERLYGLGKLAPCQLVVGFALDMDPSEPQLVRLMVLLERLESAAA